MKFIYVTTWSTVDYVNTHEVHMLVYVTTWSTVDYVSYS